MNCMNILCLMLKMFVYAYVFQILIIVKTNIKNIFGSDSSILFYPASGFSATSGLCRFAFGLALNIILFIHFTVILAGVLFLLLIYSLI